MDKKELKFARFIARVISNRTQNKVALKPEDLQIRLAESGFSGARIWIKPNVLKPPFHKVMQISGYWHNQWPMEDNTIWHQIGKNIANLFLHHENLCDELRKISSEISAITNASGMKLESYQPVAYQEILGGHCLTVIAKIKMIDERLDPISGTFRLSSRGRRPLDVLKREAEAQALRNSRKKNGIITDTMMFAALKQLPESTLERIAKLLTTKQDVVEMENLRQAENKIKYLTSKGIPVPNFIETITFKNGLLHGRIRLRDDITANRKTLLIRRDIPQSLLNTLEGKELSQLIDHPWLPKNRKIIKVRSRESGGGAIAVVFESEEICFPSGLKAIKPEDINNDQLF